jgi:hypothetical protein
LLTGFRRAYDEEIDPQRDEMFYADPSEKPTIDLMVQGISKLPPFSTKYPSVLSQASDVLRIRNFAGYVAHQETLLVGQTPESEDAKPDQKLLFISQGSDDRRPDVARCDNWMMFVSYFSKNSSESSA